MVQRFYGAALRRRHTGVQKRERLPRVKYCGFVLEQTGYAETARNNIAALVAAGADVAVELLNCCPRLPDLGPFYSDLLLPRMSRRIKHRAKIIHSTPEFFADARERNVKNVGYTVWETDKMPVGWVDACNAMDEIWLPCQWNIDTFRRCGVRVPLHKVPHTIDPDRLAERVPPLVIPGILPGTFVFYAICTWDARKNPEGLIKAYLSEFKASEPVTLVLKAYDRDNSRADGPILADRMAEIVENMGMSDEPVPQILTIVEKLSPYQMLRLHERGDCYVLPHRVEGWGMPLFEAMAMGKPTIATAFGGNLEFMNDENSYLIRYQLTPVYGMPWVRHYRGDQMWAEPDLHQLKSVMRQVYEDRESARARARRAAAELQRRYSWHEVGRQMVKLLKA